MSYHIFAKYAAEAALSSGVGRALAVAGSVPASLENAVQLQDLYQDPETAQFSPERAGESFASSFATAPGVTQMLDRAVADPRAVNYFLMLKNNPNLRLTLMNTHALMPLANELEDRINRQRFEAQRQDVQKQLEQAGTGMRERADEAAEQAAAIEEYRGEYNRLARIAGNKADPAEITRRVATGRGRGTHQRLADIERMTQETMAKPGLAIVHGNVNLAKRRELNRKIQEQVQTRQNIAAGNYQGFSQIGGLYQQVASMPGPEQINKTPRLNIERLKKTVAANIAAQGAAKQASTNQHNVFDLLLPQDKDTIGRHKRTIMYIRRHNDEDGGIKEHIQARIQDRFDSQNQFPILNNKKNESEGTPLTTKIKELHNL